MEIDEQTEESLGSPEAYKPFNRFELQKCCLFLFSYLGWLVADPVAISLNKKNFSF